ncbi:MAG: hypothetical protein EAS52_09515, partial [Parapedobacter sp.]
DFYVLLFAIFSALLFADYTRLNFRVKSTEKRRYSVLIKKQIKYIGNGYCRTGVSFTDIPA